MLSSLTHMPPKFRSCVAKMPCLVGRNVQHQQDVPVPTTRVKAAPVTTTHFAFALVFRG